MEYVISNMYKRNKIDALKRIVNLNKFKESITIECLILKTKPIRQN